MTAQHLYPKLQAYCDTLTKEFKLIPIERKAKLTRLAAYLSDQFQTGQMPQLIVICTHNSRRSHLGQVWLAISAHYYNLPAIATFSGGTEATAFYPSAVAALRKIGVVVDCADTRAANPVYQLSWKTNSTPYQAFSKSYTTAPNPQDSFGAILVCTAADEACPIVEGANFRMALPFEDPKAFDGTAQESQKYEERSRQIGRELLFTMSQVQQ
ncbi:MAG: hypothetical protein AB8G15_17980 [Saprospiraceae bacterium]